MEEFKNKSEKYSAVFELVGLKELAEHLPGTYYQHIQELVRLSRKCARDAAALEHLDGDTEFVAESALDKLFVSAPSRRMLVAFACSLRRELIFENKQLFLRGVLGGGDCFSENGVSEMEEFSYGSIKIRIMSLKIGSDGVGLHGEVENFKGVGLKCREDLGDRVEIDGDLEKVSTISSDGDSKEGSGGQRMRVFVNFTVVNVRPQKFLEFWDISLEREITDQVQYLGQVITALRGGRLKADKVSRLYVPFLLNWARTMDLSQKYNNRQLDSVVVQPGFSDLMREVPGLQLVALTFLDRIFGSSAEIVDSERKRRLMSFFLDERRKWLHRLVRLDTEPSIPSAVLSDASRIDFADKLSKSDGVGSRRRASK